MTENYIRDGKVALLLSDAYGAGWSTDDNNDARDVLRDCRLVEAFLDGGSKAVDAKVREIWPHNPPGYRSPHPLRLDWVTEGELFFVNNYDGLEWVVTENEMLRA
jgi:hypothetical protein